MNSNTMIKTHGYLVNNTTYATFTAGVEHYGGTTDGRLYWIERNDVDLAGIQIKEEVLIPRQMIVQESYQPRIYGVREYNGVGANGQVMNMEIHDLFSTVKLSNNTIDLMVGSFTNAATNQNNYFGLPVSMEPTALIGTTDQTNFGGGLLDSDFRDTEQVVACRSRKWIADLSGFNEKDFILGTAPNSMNAQVAQIPMRNIFDSSWGSGDAVASNQLHHVRIMISTMDRTNDFNGLPESSATSGWFIAVPPSIQYLTADVEKPSFLEQMTMIRRSRAL
jgi:hypothetical protein